MLLNRPERPNGGYGTETINDLDCNVSNFWRAVRRDPDAVARAADWPVNEADLHAVHREIAARLPEHRERMHREYRYFDAELAGLWVWGQCLWIGGGWCQEKRTAYQGLPELQNAQSGVVQREIGRPHLGRDNGMPRECERGTENKGSEGPETDLRTDYRGLNRELADEEGDISRHRRRPAVGGGHGGGVGVHRSAHSDPVEWQQVPDLGHAGPLGTISDGIDGQSQQMPELGGRLQCGSGIQTILVQSMGIREYMRALSARMRRVRVCCGDWSRIMGPSVTVFHGMTAVLLDPPYDQETAGRDPELYACETNVSQAVREWAIANGDNPLLRIALCGYEGEHAMPDTWEKVAWKAGGGYGNQGTAGSANRHRERIWFSPACIRPERVAEQMSLLEVDI